MNRMWVLALMIGASEAAAPVAGGAGHASFFTWTKPNTIGILYNNIPTEAITLEYWMKVTDPHMTQMSVFSYSCCTSPAHLLRERTATCFLLTLTTVPLAFYRRRGGALQRGWRPLRTGKRAAVCLHPVLHPYVSWHPVNGLQNRCLRTSVRRRLLVDSYGNDLARQWNDQILSQRHESVRVTVQRRNRWGYAYSTWRRPRCRPRGR